MMLERGYGADHPPFQKVWKSQQSFEYESVASGKGSGRSMFRLAAMITLHRKCYIAYQFPVFKVSQIVQAFLTQICL